MMQCESTLREESVLLLLIHYYYYIMFLITYVILRGFIIHQLKYRLHSALFALNDSSNHVFFNHIEERCAITLLSDQVIKVMLIFRPTVWLQVYNNKINKKLMLSNLHLLTNYFQLPCLYLLRPLNILVSNKAATNFSGDSLLFLNDLFEWINQNPRSWDALSQCKF